MAKLRCLFIAYAFPPIANAESFVAAKTIIGLAKQGVKITVITINPDSVGLNIDNTFDEQISKYIDNVIRVDLSEYECKILKSFPIITNILLQYPDKFVLFNKHLLNKLKNIDLNYYDIIITRSQWHSAHLVGLEIKKNYPKIPWIAQFSDPWVDNPYNLNFPFSRNIYLRWEREIIRLADVITYTSKETIPIVMKKYDSKYVNKVYYLPHCFDFSLYKKYNIKDKETYIIRCLGAFYGKRSPEPFYRAIEYIVANCDANLLNNVLIEFYGMDDKRKKMIDKYKCAKPFFKLYSGVSYYDSLQKMQKADCLVSIDAPLEFSPFFPSKLVDYMGSKSFIFSISPPGAANNIINYLGGCSADVNNINDIIDKTIYILKNRPNCLLNKNYIEFEQSNVTNRFYDILERVVEKNV